LAVTEIVVIMNFGFDIQRAVAFITARRRLRHAGPPRLIRNT